MLIQVNILTGCGGGKTAVSRVIEQALKDAGFTVTNTDPDVALQTDLAAAVKSISGRNHVEIVTTQASRSWMLKN